MNIQALCNLCRRKLKQASTRTLIPLQCLTSGWHQHSGLDLLKSDGSANGVQQLPLHTVNSLDSENLSNYTDDSHCKRQFADNYRGCVHYRQSSWLAGFRHWGLAVCVRFLSSCKHFKTFLYFGENPPDRHWLTKFSKVRCSFLRRLLLFPRKQLFSCEEKATATNQFEVHASIKCVLFTCN